MDGIILNDLEFGFVAKRDCQKRGVLTIAIPMRYHYTILKLNFSIVCRVLLKPFKSSL